MAGGWTEGGVLMDKVVLPGERHGVVRIPSSKSVVHRLLVCAALGGSATKVHLNGFSRDILATADCLQALGAAYKKEENSITIIPGGTPAPNALLPCGESGSTLRFLLPVAGALGAEGTFLMEGRLSQRPMAAYERLLSDHGMSLSRGGNRLHFSGQLQAGSYLLRGDISSQYFSGLLFALPLLPGESTMHAEGTLESEGYIALTEDALHQAGIRFEKPDTVTWNIPGNQKPSLPEELAAEGDWSNAAFFFCMGALSKEGVTVYGLDLASRQGDKGILDILTRFGADVTADAEKGTVTVRRKICRPLEIDASPIPDLVPVLSVLACGAEGKTRIYNASRLRLKESDRLHTTGMLIRALGGKVEERADELIIRGTGTLNGGSADSCNDHRIAMSASTAASLCSNAVVVTGAQSTDKSYPGFWDDLERCSL